MAQDEVILKLQAEVGNVTKQLEEVKKGVEGIKKTTVGAEKGIQGMAKGIKGVGLALKAAGIGILIKGLQMLGDAFMKNQKVTNLFNTVFTTLSRTLNDFVNFLVGNTGTVIDIFKDIFENPLDSIKSLGIAVYDGVVKRFHELIEAVNVFGSAFGNLVKGDFKGFVEGMKEGYTELVDAATGVDGSVGKIKEGISKAVEATKEYAVNTYNAAKAQTELNNARIKVIQVALRY